MLSGLWSVASSDSGHVPTAGEDVEIDVAGTQTITVQPGEETSVGSLLLRDDLLLDTATLNVGTDLLVDSGATLQLVNSSVLGPGGVTNTSTIQVLAAAGSTIDHIASNTGTILVQSNATTAGRLTVVNGFTNDGLIELSADPTGTGARLTLSGGTLTNAATRRSSVERRARPHQRDPGRTGSRGT